MERNAQTVRVALALVVGGLASLLNPALACTSEEEAPPWEFNEADLREAVEGTYPLHAEGTDQRVSIRIRQTSTSMRRLQCGNVSRSFVRDAGACVTLYTTEMSLEATIDSDVPDLPSGTYSGFISYEGSSLERGQGELSFSVRSPFDLQTLYQPGAASSWSFRLGEAGWLTLVPDENTDAPDGG